MLYKLTNLVRCSQTFVGLVLLLSLFWVALIPSSTAQHNAVELETPHVALLTINGAIGPATTDYFVRSLQEAKQQGATAVIIQMDTPGGLDAATRDIIKNILSSPIPIITLVYPAGARAASAGTFILYASHVAAMSKSTTLGAATPVSIGPPTMPTQPLAKDKQDQSDQEQAEEYEPETTMERKVTNDAIAYIRALAEHHGRNIEWAEKAVSQAATLTAKEALEQEVVDIVVENLDDLLIQAHDREVQMEVGTQVINIEDLKVVNYDPDWRNQLLAIITNPQIAYILLMIGIYGLVLEGYNPGALVPGVIGGICLFTAFYALQVLPVNYAGLALIILGVALIVAETLAPSFGILGIGGVLSLTLGSVMLIDSDIPGLEISRGLIAGIALSSAAVVFALLMAIGKSLRMKPVVVEKALIGETGKVESFNNGSGFIHVASERWRITCQQDLEPNQRVRVIAEDGLLLTVEPIED